MRSRHSLLMLICCLVPIGVLFALPFLGIGQSSLSFLAIILLCPLLHLIMMRRMHDHHQDVGRASGLDKAETGDDQLASLKGKRTK